MSVASGDHRFEIQDRIQLESGMQPMLPIERMDDALKEIARVLRPVGLAYISKPCSQATSTTSCASSMMKSTSTHKPSTP